MDFNSNYYKYKSYMSLLLPDEQPIPFDDVYIGDIQIERDYDNLYFPIFSVTVFFTTELYYKFIKNKTTARFKFKLEKFVTSEDNEAVRYRKVVVDDIFVTFITDSDPNLNKDLYKEANNIDSGNQRQQSGKKVELFLFKESDIKASRKMINTVIQSGSMTDALTFLLSKAGCKNVLMTPLQNTNEYNEILLLPSTTIQNILYLEKQYGFYKNGATLFFDLDATYLISKSASTTAYRDGEYQLTILNCFKSNNSKSIMSGTFDDSKRKLYNLSVSADNISFETTALVDEQISGSDIIMIDGATNESTTIDPNIDDKDSGNAKVLVNAFSNNFLSSMIENKKVEDAHMISAVIYDFDIMALTPNKRILMKFNDSAIQISHGGNYRLSSSRIILLKQGEEYTISGQILIKKSI